MGGETTPLLTLQAMSHGALHLSDAITLSATSATGQGEVSVAFDYTAESLAAHDSPSGTAGFLYTVPSPSPTAPSCSLRLSGANGSGNGPQRAVRSPTTVVGRGRRLEWDGNTSSSSGAGAGSGSSSSESTPVRPQPGPAKVGRRLTGLTSATSVGVGGLGSRVMDCNKPQRRAEGGATAAKTRDSAQQPSGGGAAGAITATTAPLSQGPPAAGAVLGAVGSVTPNRAALEAETPSPAEGAGAAAGAPPRGSGGGLFTALLDNISLSQIMQSQGTTQGTTGTQGEHAGGDAEGGGSNSNSSSGSSSSSNNSSNGGLKPVSQPSARGARAGLGAEEPEGDKARQHRGGSSASANPSRAAGNVEAADASQDGGLWSASRLRPFGSLALLDSEDNRGSGLGLDTTGRACSIPPGPHQSHTTVDGAGCDGRQQTLSPPPSGGGAASATAAADPATGVCGSIGTAAPATAVAEPCSSPPPLSPPVAASDAAAAAAAAAAASGAGVGAVTDVSVAGPSSSSAWLGGAGGGAGSAPPEDDAGTALPVAAAPPVRDGSPPVGQEQSEAVLSAPKLQNAAIGGESDASAARAALAARAEYDGGSGGTGAGAGEVVDVGSAGAAEASGNEREDSPAFSVASSLNLALSLTPEVSKCPHRVAM